MIPISLERIIMKCTQKKPELRYNSATELIEDLKKSLTMPNEDFVKIKQLSSDSPTMIFNGRDVDRIKNETRARTEHDRRAEHAYQMDMEDSEYRNRRDRYGDDDDEDDEDDDEDEDEEEEEERPRRKKGKSKDWQSRNFLDDDDLEFEFLDLK